jgi:cytosine/uracil/thiamine/allantoin permease
LMLGHVAGSLAVGIVVMGPLALGMLRGVADQLGGPVLGIAAKLVGGAVLGAVIGAAQWLVLRRRLRTAAWWIVASTSAYAAATVVPSIAALGALVGSSAAVIADRFVYGAVVGSITGFALLWLLRRQRPTRAAPRKPKALHS